MTGGLDREWEHAQSLGLAIDGLAALNARLVADFSADHWGFEQFGDIPEGSSRAVASDQLLMAADSIRTNLIEARVHEKLYGELAAGGVSSVDPEHDSVVRDIHVVGFFRAFGSTLDCMAGAAIGVMRVPRPILTASMPHLFDLNPNTAENAQQALVWSDFRTLIDAARNGRWLDWALRYRNALVHRPRQLAMYLPRPVDSQIYLPRAAALERLRYDLHLRAKPWLPDMEHLASPGERVEDLILAEPATVTVRGLIERTNELTEETAWFLLETWKQSAAGACNLPAPKTWGPLRDSDDVDFIGFAPTVSPVGTDTMVGHPQLVERLRLAERIRVESP